MMKRCIERRTNIDKDVIYKIVNNRTNTDFY